MCVVKTCAMMTDSCSCAQMAGCLWRNEQCKDTAFMQCPAIDIVFLVESTLVMLDDFQRHPNGFYGIVEAIRTWSRRTPFSQNDTATGFRMAFIQYGAARRALQAPIGIGGGGNVTGSRDAWIGVNQELDWHEDQQDRYARSVEGSVAVKPGLTAAVSVFQKAAPGRTRILMVLGCSPITDGANSLGPVISELEGLGVHVFTAVLRRFSVITPLGVTAASFYGPLATDPNSKHFSFTTIEDMRTKLLEGFCDPSTNTGSVLEISRDRTIPCNWLSRSHECGIQGSCEWNSSATRVCPLSIQCANLDCAELPDSIRKAGFECRHCRLVSGMFQCSRENNFVSQAGLCIKSPCSLRCNDTCSLTPSCSWEPSKQRCDRRMCVPLSNDSACNNDFGCVWDMVSTATTCRNSQCGLWRTKSACEAAQAQVGFFKFSPCTWNEQVVPAICVEMRCPYLDPRSCQVKPSVCAYSPIAQPYRCSDRRCSYATSEDCEMDSQCNWNPYLQSMSGRAN